jgi:hypothetical protein
MNVRKSIDKIDAGRRAATLVLQRLDLGLDPVAVVRDVAPTLSPLAVESAARLAGLASFDFACLAVVLAGLADDSVLRGAEIPQAPARPSRPSPEQIAEALMFGTPLTDTPERSASVADDLDDL